MSLCEPKHHQEPSTNKENVIPVVEDGPNCPEKYKNATPRILHLLKQPTMGPPDQPLSLPELVQKIVKVNEGSERSDIGRKMMYRLAQRSYGIQNGFSSWEKVADRDDATIGDALLSSAIVNIKNDKYSGTTKPNDLYEWAKTEFTKWHGRVEEFNPQIVLCGGTFKAVCWAFDEVSGNEIYITHASTGMKYFCDHGPKIPSCVYLDAPHPSARYPVSMVYTYLMSSAKDILNKAGHRL